MFQPRICPASGATTWTVAPACFSLSRGTSSSACSKPCVARITNFFPEIFVGLLFVGFRFGQREPDCFGSWRAARLPNRSAPERIVACCAASDALAGPSRFTAFPSPLRPTTTLLHFFDTWDGASLQPADRDELRRGRKAFMDD